MSVNTRDCKVGKLYRWLCDDGTPVWKGAYHDLAGVHPGFDGRPRRLKAGDCFLVVGREDVYLGDARREEFRYDCVWVLVKDFVGYLSLSQIGWPVEELT